MGKQKQHIVPRTYLAHFSDKDGVLHVLNKDDEFKPRIQQLHAGSKVFWQTNYYSPENSSSPKAIERFFAEAIEPTYSAIIKVVKGERPISDWRTKELLLQWLFYSKRRSPLWRALMSDQMGEIVQDPETPLEDDMREFVRSNMERVAKHAHLQLLLEEPRLRMDMEQFVGAVGCKQWEILKAPVGHPWWTSDNPGCGVQLDKATTIEGSLPNPLWENIDSDSLLYYPLTSSHALCIFPYNQGRNPYHNISNQDIGFRVASSREVRLVNYWTAVNQYRLVVSSTRESLLELEALHLAR